MVQKDTCTPVFIAALFTIAKTWKQPKCPSTGVHKEDVGGVCVCVILLSHKKDEILPFGATWMDLEIIILSEVR